MKNLSTNSMAKLAAAHAYLDARGINRSRPGCRHPYEQANPMDVLRVANFKPRVTIRAPYFTRR